MLKKLIYIAEKEEVTIWGLNQILMTSPLPAAVCGYGRNAQEILDDFSVRLPDILLISDVLLAGEEALSQHIIQNRMQTITVLMDTGSSASAAFVFPADCCIKKAEINEKTILELWDSIHALSLRRTEDSFKLQLMKNYILSHLRDKLSLNDLSMELQCSYHYLTVLFSRYFPQGFRQYVNHLRIEKACELLDRGGMSIAEISNAVGFSSQSYFSHTFKKQMHCSPKEYSQLT